MIVVFAFSSDNKSYDTFLSHRMLSLGKQKRTYVSLRHEGYSADYCHYKLWFSKNNHKNLKK